jgi:hypothetical protein
MVGIVFNPTKYNVYTNPETVARELNLHLQQVKQSAYTRADPTYWTFSIGF